MKNYQHQNVLSDLSKKHDVHVDSTKGSIQILNSKSPDKKGDLGIKTLGKIDFLQNHLGYNVRTVSKFTKS